MTRFDNENAPKQQIKTITRIIRIAVIAVIAIIIVFSSFYNISEQENGVVTMFGQVLRTDTAGLHFKIPLVQRVHKVDITTHGTGIGYNVSPEGQNIVDTMDGIMITKDFNLVNIDFYLEYRVTDPVAYLYNSKNPEEIMHNITMSAIRSTVVNYTVDECMTTGKSSIQSDVKSRIIEELNQHNIGLSVVNITIQDAEPPTQEIINAFKAVETAKQGADTKLNEAHKYSNEQLPMARAEADRITQQAEAQKAARIAEAEGQVARFTAMYEEYKKNPDLTKRRMFYEALEDVLPSLKIIITDGSTETVLPLDNFANFPNTTE